jgi:hypothetical protein
MHRHLEEKIAVLRVSYVILSETKCVPKSPLNPGSVIDFGLRKGLYDYVSWDFMSYMFFFFIFFL